MSTERKGMSTESIASLAGEEFLYLTTIGRKTGLPREIEIWFIVCRERFYLFCEHGETAGWVRNIRHNPKVSVRVGGRGFEATARVLDHERDRKLWDEVQAVANRKYGWGDGLPVEIAPNL